MNEQISVMRKVVAEAGRFRAIKATVKVTFLDENGNVLADTEQSTYWIQPQDGVAIGMPTPCYNDAAARKQVVFMNQQAEEAKRQLSTPKS